MTPPTSLLDHAVNALLRTEALPARVQAPTLIVRATQETRAPDRGFVLPAEEAERVHGLIAGSRYVEIPQTNHYTIVTAPLFAREALSFLETQG